MLLSSLGGVGTFLELKPSSNKGCHVLSIKDSSSCCCHALHILIEWLFLANHCQSVIHTLQPQAKKSYLLRQWLSDLENSLAHGHNACQISIEHIEMKFKFYFLPFPSFPTPVVFVMPGMMYVLG